MNLIKLKISQPGVGKYQLSWIGDVIGCKELGLMPTKIGVNANHTQSLANLLTRARNTPGCTIDSTQAVTIGAYADSLLPKNDIEFIKAIWVATYVHRFSRKGFDLKFAPGCSMDERLKQCSNKHAKLIR